MVLPYLTDKSKLESQIAEFVTTPHLQQYNVIGRFKFNNMSQESDKAIEQAIEKMAKKPINSQNKGLIEIFTELKFGRKAFDQLFLDKCISELKMFNS